jgi:hypothetical protein
VSPADTGQAADPGNALAERVKKPPGRRGWATLAPTSLTERSDAHPHPHAATGDAGSTGDPGSVADPAPGGRPPGGGRGGHHPRLGPLARRHDRRDGGPGQRLGDDPGRRGGTAPGGRRPDLRRAPGVRARAQRPRGPRLDLGLHTPRGAGRVAGRRPVPDVHRRARGGRVRDPLARTGPPRRRRLRRRRPHRRGGLRPAPPRPPAAVGHARRRRPGAAGPHRLPGPGRGGPRSPAPAGPRPRPAAAGPGPGSSSGWGPG